jgi:nicotinamide mononucleotide (NMN) deamidase PncC
MTNKLAFRQSEDHWESLLEQLSNTKIQIAMVVTGGGTGAISHCLRRPGASLNFVEAVIPYSRMATQLYLGLEPTEGYASEHTANALAQVAHSRATSLSQKGHRSFGIALTATLPTKPHGTEANSAQNCCVHVVSHNTQIRRGWSLSFTGEQSDRDVAESIAEQMFLIALQDSLYQNGIAVSSDPLLPLKSAGLQVSMTHPFDSSGA